METVKNMQEIAELKQRVEFLESKVFKPELTNLQHISLLYNWFESIAGEITDFPDKDSTEYKQVFLFCILILYCPRVITGGFLVRGVRRSLAMLFDLSPSHISNLIKNIFFYYQNYSKFRNACDVVLAELMFKIEMNRLK